MKKGLLITILILALSFAVPFASVLAENTAATAETPIYYRIDSAVTVSDLDTDGLGEENNVVLPATYYVKYVQDYFGYGQKVGIKVTYNGFSCLILSADVSSKLTPIYTEVKSPYFTVSGLKVANIPEIEGISLSPKLLKDTVSNQSKDGAGIIKNNDALEFIALADNGYYFVKHKVNGEYGYIKSNLTSSSDIVYTDWTDPDASGGDNNGGDDNNGSDDGNGGGTITPPSDGGKTDETAKNNLPKILLIVSICVLAVLLVFLVFKPTRSKRRRYELDNDDFDDDYRNGYRGGGRDRY